MNCYNFLQPFATIHGKYFDKPSLSVNGNFVNDKKSIEFLAKRWQVLEKTKGITNISDALKNSQKLGYVDKVHYSLGITKAYTTRVGHGPFPSELDNQLGQDIAKWGGEVGATTGRARRCGWLDLKILKQSIELNRINGIALTKLDVLDNLEKIKICVEYGEINYDDFTTSDIKYIEMDGWESSTVGITQYEDLPENAKKYINTIEQISDTKVVMVSTGPSRDQIIILQDIFT